MSSSKAKWNTPQLIILARGTPEESVLLHCKRIGEFVDLPSLTAQEGCDMGVNENCGACQSRSGS